MVIRGQACWTVGLWATCASLILLVACKTFGISSKFVQILQLINRNFKLLIVTISVNHYQTVEWNFLPFHIFKWPPSSCFIYKYYSIFFCQIHVIFGSMQLCITVWTNVVTHDTKHKIRIIMITCNILY